MIDSPYREIKGYFVKRSSVFNAIELESMNTVCRTPSPCEKQTTSLDKTHSCLREMYKNSFMEEVR